MKSKSLIILSVSALVLTGCLKTRSQVSEYDQSMVYRKKQAENQKAESKTTKTSTVEAAAPTVAESEETIRDLNGRIEILENQLGQLQKEKADQTNADAQKIATLQDALNKMDGQLQKAEMEKTVAMNANAALEKKRTSDENFKANQAPAETSKSSTKTTTAAPVAAADAKKSTTNSYDLAQDFFEKKDWKKAILNYQKFVEEFPKSKNVPDAKYKTGVSFQELGLKDEAMAFYEEVALQYPSAAAGKKAKTRIAGLKKK